MCGVAGGLRLLAMADLQRMNDLLVHRGPDEAGFYDGGWVKLAMRRLSILDHSGGKQPMASDDGRVVLVFNGEIYNWKELRQELEALGHHFRTRGSDTEVVLHAYMQYGVECFEKLNGMYVICIADQGRQELVLARDPVGEKPVYLCGGASPAGLVFASEFPVLSRPPDLKDLDLEAMVWYLAFRTMPRDKSIHRKVRKLPAGHLLKCDAKGGSSETRFWKGIDRTARPPADETAAADEFLSILKDSVRLRMRADVDVGFLLSGGVDSSLLVALCAPESERPLKTYTLVYDEEIYRKSADRKWAREVAGTFRTDHTEVLLTPAIFMESIPRIVRQYGQPNAVSFATWFVAREMAKKVKVAINGDGADELFGSYFLHRIAGALSDLNSGAAGQLPAGLSDFERDYVLAHRTSPLPVVVGDFAVFPQSEMERLLRPEVLARTPSIGKIIEKRGREVTAHTPLAWMLEFDLRNFIVEQILNFTDVLGMAHSLEIRVPYLDPRIIQLVSTLPDDLRIRGGVVKYLLKKVAERFLPAELVHRPKEGFAEPNIVWLHSAMREFCRSYLESATFDRFGIFERAYVQSLIERFYSGNDFFVGKRLWVLLMYAVWEREAYG